MCRLLGYLGKSVQLNYLLEKPEHSLIVQSYQPREMTSGLLNADGFGIGWYHPEKEAFPYTYKNTLPIWSDINLPQLTRYIVSNCVLGYVRSATPGLSVDLLNCQPFTRENLLFVHNGYIDNFRKTLYRPIRNSLSDRIYQAIHGTTDSEHIFALILNQWQLEPELSLQEALARALKQLDELAIAHNANFSANIILGNGKEMVACRHSNRQSCPTLYYLQDDMLFPDSVIVASEPLFAGNWKSCSEKSIISVRKNLEVSIDSIP
ncbi:MAG: ergothioneine biosynthesis protein EgtC [Pleurocapsa sp.]